MSQAAGPFFIGNLLGLSAVAVAPSPPPVPTYGGGLTTITARPVPRELRLGRQIARIAILAVGNLRIVPLQASGHLRVHSEAEDLILLGIQPDESEPGSEQEDLWLLFRQTE